MCLQRWLILHEFLSDYDPAGRCIYLDSDILVYDDLMEPEADFAPYGMTKQGCSGHSSFINSVAVLGEFTRFILYRYEKAEGIADLRRQTEAMRKIGNWNLSDMSFFMLYHEQHPNKMASLQFPMRNHYALDQTIDSDFGGFEMENGFKKINWQAGIPYCRHLSTGNLVRFCTLHFQGQSKKRMMDFCPPMGIPIKIGYLFNYLGFIAWRFQGALERRIWVHPKKTSSLTNLKPNR